MYKHLIKRALNTKNQFIPSKLTLLNLLKQSACLSNKFKYSKQLHTINSPVKHSFKCKMPINYLSSLEIKSKSRILSLSKNCFSTTPDLATEKLISKQIMDVNAESEEFQVMKNVDPTKIRNVAIIAHVDHGKTTLVDCMLSQAGLNLSNERVMDSNDLEKERGITILSKCTAISYNGMKINIVDTPGHQDFGGEVERIMNMVDSVILVVCASEGPMPQTRFVLKKALQRGLKPVVVINKVDRENSRVVEVENEIFDLFIALEANEEQMSYPLLYASAKNGWASVERPSKASSKPNSNIFPLLEKIISYVPHPTVDLTKDFTMLVSQIESNQFFGKMLIGRIHSGMVQVGMKVSAFDQTGKQVESAKVFKLVRKFGTQQIELKVAGAGDIILLSGFNLATVTHTINKEGNSTVIPVSILIVK